MIRIKLSIIPVDGMWLKRKDEIGFFSLSQLPEKNDLASHIETMSKAHEMSAVGEYLNSSDQHY